MKETKCIRMYVSALCAISFQDISNLGSPQLPAFSFSLLAIYHSFCHPNLLNRSLTICFHFFCLQLSCEYSLSCLSSLAIPKISNVSFLFYCLCFLVVHVCLKIDSSLTCSAHDILIICQLHHNSVGSSLFFCDEILQHLMPYRRSDVALLLHYTYR